MPKYFSSKTLETETSTKINTLPVSQAQETQESRDRLTSRRDAVREGFFFFFFWESLCSLTLVSKSLPLCPFTLLWRWQPATVKTVSFPACAWVLEHRDTQRWFSVYLFSMARRGEVGLLDTGSPHHHHLFFFSFLQLLSIPDKESNKRRGMG